MAGKREKPEETVSKPRQVEGLLGQGATIAKAERQGGGDAFKPPLVRGECRSNRRLSDGIKRGPWPQWGRDSPDELDGGMRRSQRARLKEQEKESQRLRRAVSDLTLDKLIRAEAAKDDWRLANHPVDGLQP